MIKVTLWNAEKIVKEIDLSMDEIGQEGIIRYKSLFYRYDDKTSTAAHLNFRYVNILDIH